MTGRRLTTTELVPPEVAARWLRFREGAAQRWLGDLPDEVHAAAGRWNVQIEEPLWGGTQSVTVGGTREGEPVVLKVAAPWATWSEAEAAALAAWGGQGAPRLLGAEQRSRTLVLERLFPGTPPAELQPEAVGEVIERLRPIAAGRLPLSVPPLRDAVRQRFARAAENRHGLVTDDRRLAACAAAVALADEPPARPGLVHGDLVTKNILLADGRGLAAIDPNPAQGDTAYDAALWIVTQPDPTRFSDHASRLARSLGIDAAVILRWVVILAVPEACLASRPRAEASLAYVNDHRPGWF